MENSNITKFHIVKTATELFARYGLKKTTMDEIAESAGIAKGTIYIYFDSKEKLFSEIVKNEAEEFFRKLEAIVGSAPTAEAKLKSFIRSFFEILLNYINLYNIAFNTAFEINSLMPSLQKELEQYHARINGIIRDILQQGIADSSFREIEVDLIIETFKDMMTAIGYPFSPFILEQQKATVFRKIDVIMDLIINGLKK